MAWHERYRLEIRESGDDEHVGSWTFFWWGSVQRKYEFSVSLWRIVMQSAFSEHYVDIVVTDSEGSVVRQQRIYGKR